MKNTHWISRFFCVLFVTLIFLGCSNDQTDKKVEAPPPPAPLPPVEAPKVKEKVAPTTVTATFQNATVYAAATDYYFETKEGKILEIRVSNLKKQQKVKLPEGMLVPSEEGPPDPNPEMIGKLFKIDYNENGEAVEFALIEN